MKKSLVIVVGLAVVVFAAGYFTASRTSSSTEPTNKGYPLLAKRLFVENPNDTRINFSPLRSELNQYFADNNLKGSLYFEYLPTGTSVRVDPDGRYRAASLIKLPVAMELYKAKELGRLDIDKKVAVKAEWLNDSFGTLYEKGPGYEISLREAAKIMLEESDNTALRMIIDANDRVLGIDDRALGALDIELTSHPDGSIDIGTRSYSSFLKCLYFACYNDMEDSQEILKMLTETPFANRLAAGVEDKDIRVAHKIGVFNTQVQSDCGIVYLPNNHYVLCIMLSGNDDDRTNSTIAELSKIVYSYLKN